MFDLFKSVVLFFIPSLDRDQVVSLVQKATWTFFQAFAATETLTPLSTTKEFQVAAVAALLSAIKTTLVEERRNRKEDAEFREMMANLIRTD